MRTLTMELTAPTDGDLELSLEVIAENIREGYSSGYTMSGGWSITGEEEQDAEDDE